MIRRFFEDFASSPIMNTYAVTMLGCAAVSLWRSDMHGCLLFVILSNQALAQKGKS